MRTLKAAMYKNIASILSSDNQEFRSAQNIVIFSRIISIYPSKSVYCLAAHRIISFIEKNVNRISLILDIMRDEGEDEEIINTIEQLHREPTIKTKTEVNQLIRILADYIRWEKILKLKESWLSSIDMIDDEDAPIKETVDTMYKMATEIQSAYNIANVSEVSHTVYQGLPGNYKSGILLKGHVDTLKYNEHLKKATGGKIPISMYISMENTMSQTVRRLWSLLYPSADMNSFSVDEITEMIESALTENGMRSVILYYGYREKSTADIANIIRSYNTDETEVVALFFDYIKRVRPARTDAAATASEKSELNAIMNEFKLICSQFNIPIITGHQLNREAARMVDEVVRQGGYNKTDSALSRSQTGSALNSGAMAA